ncbi:MAG: VacJ family lipoprotein, partial [Arcobacteraceae bacterium]|nr:VacJ family lipoprotein [Arcobacteraceae bacterium]
MKKSISMVLASLFILTMSEASVFIQQEETSSYSTNKQEVFSDFDNEFEESDAVFDPLNGYNRMMTNFNDSFYINILQPVSKTYADIVHEDIRTGVSNVYDNLLFPIRFINNVLQLKFVNASEELGRFVINSTFGLLGIMDVAQKFELKAHKEDFGQTLGFYGVGSGFHIVIPFLGPSNLRDVFGIGADSYANPLSTLVAYEPYQIPDNTLQELGYRSYNLINENSFHP